MIPSDNQCNKKHPRILQVGRALFQQFKLWGLFCFLAVFLSFSAKANQQVENFRITKKNLADFAAGKCTTITVGSARSAAQSALYLQG